MMAKTLVISSIFFASSILSCKAQDTLTLTSKYISSSWKSTKNKSFMNKEFLFAREGDTIRLNQKLPTDRKKAKVHDFGIYYNCHLKKDALYTITLQKVGTDDIPKETNSYYKLNAIFNDENDKSKFTEIKKDTKYLYNGYYGRYVDIDNILYKIVGLSPDNDCFYPH